MSRMEVAEKRVAKGAALLDEQIPDWREKVTERLDMSDCSRCVLGQVFEGNYFEATFELHLSHSADGGFTDWEYGFDTSPTWSLGDDEPTYVDLAAAWHDHIYDKALV